MSSATEFWQVAGVFLALLRWRVQSARVRRALRKIGLSILTTAFAFTFGCTSDGLNGVPSPSSTAATSCVESAKLARAGPLTVDLNVNPRCGAPVEASLRVTNSSDSTCVSNIRGQLTNGQDMTFASTSGEGGERGSWLPTSETEIADGILEFPHGDRVWPIVLPQLPPGEYGFALPPISCGQDHLEITVTFTVASS